MTHHSHLGDYEKDMDFQNLKEFQFEALLLPRI